MVYQTFKPFVTNVPVIVVLLWFGYISHMTYKHPEGEKRVVLIFLSLSVLSVVLHVYVFQINLC